MTERSIDRATDAAVPAVAGLAVVHPALAVAATAVAPSVAEFVKAALGRIRTRRDDRLERLLVWAAEFAGVDPTELVQRCEANPDTEQLLLRTLRATSETALREKVLVFALALAHGSRPEAEPDEVERETAFVRTLEDLDEAHLGLLRRFTKTANELGLGDGSTDFDRIPDVVGPGQLEVGWSNVNNLPALLATLQRNGLIDGHAGSGGMSFYNGGVNTLKWRLTAFGRDVLARLAEIGAILASGITGG